MKISLISTIAVALIIGVATPHLQAEEFQIDIQISPAVLVLGSPSDWITVHTDLDFGLAVTDTLELNGIQAAFAYADSRNNLVVKFHRDDIEAIVECPESSLELTGETINGFFFWGVDTVQVLNYKGPK